MKKNAELIEITFPASGMKVFVEAMSPAGIAMKLRRKFPVPNPPQQVVDYGNGHKVREYNYAHPDYKEALAQHALFINQQTEKIVMERAVRSISLNEEQRAMLAEWKKENPDLYDDGDRDEHLFFEEFCVVDEEDLYEFIKAVSGYDPSEAEIEAAANGFPGDVS